MTLTEATAICRQWLPKEHKEHWEPGLRHDTFKELEGICALCRTGAGHYPPMPPASWDLAGAMLEAVRHEYTQYNSNPVGKCTFAFFDNCDFSLGQATADTPLDAILIAAATYIEAQEK